MPRSLPLVAAVLETTLLACGVEAPGPVGDRAFEEVFAEQFAQLAASFPSLTKAPTPSYNPVCGCSSHFQNYTFDYDGYHFIALDLVTPAEKDGGTVRLIQLYGDRRVEYGTFL
jgi:hypothetical protein